MEDKITDICGSLSRMCQALVKGWPLRFKWNQHDFSAEKAFAEDKFFPLFIHMAMKLPPQDDTLRCAQFADHSNPFRLGAVVPSYGDPTHEEKWEFRLRKIIDSYKAQASYNHRTIDLGNHVPDFSVDTYGDGIPTFHDAAEALKYFHEQDVMKMCGELDASFATLKEMETGSPEWVGQYQSLKSRIARRRLPSDKQKIYEARLRELPDLLPAEVLRIHTDQVDLTDKLSEDCKTMASSSPVRYDIQGEMLSNDETFDVDGMLPVFLFLAKEMVIPPFLASAKSGLRRRVSISAWV